MTVDELFAKAQSRIAENVQFVIDENLRIITVPESAAVFGVETDKDVNTAGFTINRFYSEVDLSEFSIRVSFANANNEMDFFDATDITVEDSTVSFSWLMGASAFKYKGTIQFAVNFFKADSSGTIQQAYNTTIATGQCLSGLNVNTADLPDTDYSELILHIQQQIQQTGQEQKQAVEEAGAQQLSQIKAANAHPPQPNTATGVWQTWDATTGQYVDTAAPYRGQGVPDPTHADAGKVPVVNAEGTGYALEEISTGGGGEPGQPGADGEDGGYYTPSVDTAGNLSWTPSKVGMPSVPEANIRGPEGPPYTLTEEDKQSIVQAVIAALPDGDAVSYGAPEPGIVTTDNQYYTAIAAAIRQKLGTSTEYQPADMAAAIQSIGDQTGVPVTFYGTNSVSASNTVGGRHFAGLKIYGKSVQSAPGTADSPAPIINSGASGTLALTVTDRGSQSQSLSVSVSTGLAGLQVASGGDFVDTSGNHWVCDYADFGTSKIITATLTATASKVVSISNGRQADSDYWGCEINDFVDILQDYSASAMCNMATFTGINTTTIHGPQFTIIPTNGYLIVGIPKTAGSSISEIDSFLQSHPIQFVFVASSTTERPIQSEDILAYNALTSYAGTTIISTTEEVAGMEATVYCDTGATIQSLQTEVQALSNTAAQTSQVVNTMLGVEN